MLSKKNRLSREAFNRFFSLGRRVHSPYSTLVYAPHDTLHASVVVSKKVSLRAVVRNKVRRRIYETVRTYAREHGTIGVFIFVTKKGVESLPFNALKDEVVAQLARVIQ